MNKFIIFRALTTESQSHFEMSKRVKDLLKCHHAVSPLNFAERKLKDVRTTSHSLHFAIVADKLDFIQPKGG